MRTLLVIALSLIGSTALAQDTDDLDGGPKASKKKARTFEGELVREVERGTYLKGGAGSSQYFGIGGTPYGKIIDPVVAMELALGQDFIDKERMSAAWEIDLHQALHNGPKADDLSALPESGLPLIQGDVHIFTIAAAFEASTYLSRRFSLGVRAGGGIAVMPLLIEAETYNNTIVPEAWGGVPATVHGSPLPLAFGGPCIEYYTKLSHFSVGLDADVAYVIGFDLGLNGTGYLKYTF